MFAARGFMGVSIRDIVDAAAVSRPVLYYHFGSKQGLYVATVRQAAAEFHAALDAVAAGDSGIEERIVRLCRAYALCRCEWRLLPADAEDHTPGTDATACDAELGRCLALAVDAVQDLVAEGIGRGVFAPCDPRDAAFALLGAAEGCAATVFCRPGEVGESDRLNRVLAVVFRGLEPGCGS